MSPRNIGNPFRDYQKPDYLIQQNNSFDHQSGVFADQRVCQTPLIAPTGDRLWSRLSVSAAPVSKRPKVTPSTMNSTDVPSVASSLSSACHGLRAPVFRMVGFEGDMELAAYHLMAMGAVNQQNPVGDAQGITTLIEAARTLAGDGATGLTRLHDSADHVDDERFAENDSEDSTVEDSDLWDGQVIDGTVFRDDQGRFPLLSAQDASQRHHNYRQNIIRINIPAYYAEKQNLEEYLNSDNPFRSIYKAQRMSVCRLQPADIEKLGCLLVGKRVSVGVKALRDMPSGELLGIYEGVLLTTKEDVYSRLAMMKGDSRITDAELQQTMWDRCWDLSPTDQSHEPIVSSGTTVQDQHPIGCMLTHVTPAYRMSGNKIVYNNKLLNVKRVSLQTTLAARVGLERDMVAYYTAKKVKAGDLLCMGFGEVYLNSINQEHQTADQIPARLSQSLTAQPSHSVQMTPSQPGILRRYDYDQARNGVYPLRIFNAHEHTIQDIRPDTLRHLLNNQVIHAPHSLKALIVADEPVLHAKTSMLTWDGRVQGKYAGTTLIKLQKQVVDFLMMDENQRAEHFNSFFTVRDNKVFTKKPIEKGAFLGLYAGVIFKLSDLSRVAQQLNRHPLDVERFALNLYDRGNQADQFYITAQGAGNVLELIDYGDDSLVQARKVVIFSNKIGLPVPDSMLFVAMSDIPRNKCLTTEKR